MVMHRNFATTIFTTLTISATLSACAAMPAGTSSTMLASPIASPSALAMSHRFASILYPYAVDLPAGWTVVASSQGPGSDTDDFSSADASINVSLGSGQPESGQTVADRVQLGRDQFPHCTSVPGDDISIDMGGEEGVLWSYTCVDTFHLAAQTIHNRVGYRMTVHVQRADLVQAREIMTKLLAGFAFSDGPAGSPSAP